MSVTRGQYDARLTVTFLAARHHRPLAGTNYTTGAESMQYAVCKYAGDLTPQLFMWGILISISP